MPKVQQAVWKFPVGVADEFDLEMPTGAQILSVQVQGDGNSPADVCMWAICPTHPSAGVEVRKFCVYGTGHWHPNISELKFIGTFQLFGGSFVGHLFEEV